MTESRTWRERAEEHASDFRAFFSSPAYAIWREAMEELAETHKRKALHGETPQEREEARTRYLATLDSADMAEQIRASVYPS